MTTRELVHCLQECDPDKPVYFRNHPDGPGEPQGAREVRYLRSFEDILLLSDIEED